MSFSVVQKFYLKALLILAGPSLFAQLDLPYRESQTLEYQEVIEAYQSLATIYSEAELQEVGITDCGRPLHLFLMHKSELGAGKNLREMSEGNAVVLINNGIHPGESCGIDASLLYAQELLERGLPENVLIALIPVYNIGGALNRGSHSRANQVGPEEHGFRGNAQNLDLNRDFIKADALNTKSFHALFQAVQPHIFVDTHTSNGADYQYTMTLISTQQDKLAPPLARLLKSDLEPYLYQSMAKSGWEMTPYVNVFGRVPNQGFSAFLETPRYASGYTALFNTIGFITETHMLKPYADRVESTQNFLENITSYVASNVEKLKAARTQAFTSDAREHHFALNWELDSTSVDSLDFKGYHYEYQQSQLGPYERLKYHSDSPVTYQIPYYGHYKPVDSARVPRYFVLPQAWRKVVELLQYQNIKMKALQSDTVIQVQETYITDYKFPRQPYEGHFLMQQVKTSETPGERKFLKGDFLVPAKQKNIRYLMAVLEPTAADSYLRWNFFNSIFERKEYFSAYVFEETAAQLLANNPDLKEDFENWKKENPDAAKNAYRSLSFIYKRSPYYEKEHLRYPIAKIY